MQTSKNIYQFFEQYNGILTTKEINENHIDRKQLNKMAHKGEVNLMKQSVYWWEKIIPNNELSMLPRIVPKGVVCLYTAFLYHDLSNFISRQYHLAVPNLVTLPSYPPIKLHKSDIMDLGAEPILIDNTIVRIYNPSRCLCDALRFEHKLNAEVVEEVCENYLHAHNNNRNQLIEYAKRTDVLAKVLKIIS